MKTKKKGNPCKMKESIIKLKIGPYPKKYTAYIHNHKTKKTKTLSFGDARYQQYKDRTKLKYYKKLNHGDRRRMRLYYQRHSGVKTRKKGIEKEKKLSNCYYTPKILSHIYLW